MSADLKFLIGSIVTIFSSILGSALAVYLTLKNDRKKNVQHSLDEKRAICSALYTELKIITEFYNDEYGTKFRNSSANEINKVYYPYPHKTFSIYEANASAIGKIIEDSLRDSIVIAYSNLKNLFDSFEVYNSLLKKWADLIHEINNTDHLTQGPAHKYLFSRINDQEVTLALYANGLREQDQFCMEAVRNALKELRIVCN